MKIISIIPGGEWIAAYKQEDGSVLCSPLVAWALEEDDRGVRLISPIDTCLDGECQDPRCQMNFVGVFHAIEGMAQWKVPDFIMDAAKDVK